MSNTYNGALNAMIHVKDVLKSAAFYRDILGFKFEGFWGEEGMTPTWDKETQPFYAGFNIGGGYFGIHPQENADQAPNKSVLFHFNVDDVDAFYESMKDKIDMTAPRDEPWGARVVEFKDPDGYPVNVHTMKA